MPSAPICSVEGCGNSPFSKGLCGTHYKTHYIPIRTCTVEGCSRPHLAKGTCRFHYQKLKAQGTCDVDGCTKPVNTKGMCVSHWRRYRKFGTPNVQYPRPKRNRLDFIQTAASYRGSDCLIWPFTINKVHGYAETKIRRKTSRVNRLVCHLAHGDPPSPTHVAAHLCGNRACVNPNHLRWCTTVENHSHRIWHGTAFIGDTHPRRKLSSDQVREIFSLGGSTRAGDVAMRFGVSENHVKKIWAGESWRHLCLKK